MTGDVTAMPDFLAKFFPDIAAAQHAGPAPSASRQVQYCLFDDQGLQLFTSSLYLAGTASTLAGSYTSRCGLFFVDPSSTVYHIARRCHHGHVLPAVLHCGCPMNACGSGRSLGDVLSLLSTSLAAPNDGV